MNSNQFTATIPIHLIKGKDTNGNPLMKMEGVASTPTLDSDGEFLDPKGFETDYFLKYGYMNWNHQTNTDPLSIVGKPNSATVDKANQFKIGFNLFPESAKAQQIYELQQILEAQGMALGLSIEGKVIERDKDDPRIVKKAKITGCAITPNPKNQDTVMSIIKGQSFNELSAYDDASEEEREKALSAQSPSGQALAKESLHGNLINKQCTDGAKKMSKGEFFEKIFRDLPSISIKGAQHLYDLTYKIEKAIIMSKEVTQQQEGFVSEEAIQKALEALELTSDSTEQPVIEEQPEVVANEITQDPIEEPVEQPQIDSKDQALNKALETIKTLKKALEAQSPTEQPQIEQPIAEPVDIQKGDSNSELIKGIKQLFDDQIGGLSAKVDQKLQAVGVLTKGMIDQNKDIIDRLTTLEGQPVGRKSITTQAFVEKSFGDGDLNKGGEAQELSVTRNKRQICDLLTKSITNETGITDQSMASQIMAFEQAGTITKGLIEKTKQLGYSLVK